MSSSGDSGAAEPAAALRIVCGPTAAGKSAVAMALAERHGLTIVSADSRQIYRGFDIGTAKPPAADRARVPHRGFDVADPTERWSAGRWAADAARWIADAGAGNVLVVGGTGFYLKALTAPLFHEPPLDPAQRAALAGELAGRATEELRRWCETLDAPRARLGRSQLLRSIEMALLTGRRLSDLHREQSRVPRRFRPVWLVVDPGPGLASHIARRLDEMFARGWLEEVRVLDRAVHADAPAWQACGYREMRELARGSRSQASAREDILIGTRQYAKRQRTWFRHQLRDGDVTRLDPQDTRTDALADAWWRHTEARDER